MGDGNQPSRWQRRLHERITEDNEIGRFEILLVPIIIPKLFRNPCNRADSRCGCRRPSIFSCQRTLSLAINRQPRPAVPDPRHPIPETRL